jgi:hypothetical protein
MKTHQAIMCVLLSLFFPPLTQSFVAYCSLLMEFTIFMYYISNIIIICQCWIVLLHFLLPLCCTKFNSCLLQFIHSFICIHAHTHTHTNKQKNTLSHTNTHVHHIPLSTRNLFLDTRGLTEWQWRGVISVYYLWICIPGIVIHYLFSKY